MSRDPHSYRWYRRGLAKLVRRKGQTVSDAMDTNGQRWHHEAKAETRKRPSPVVFDDTARGSIRLA